MVKQIIPFDPSRCKDVFQDRNYLSISEFYYDTIQGEGFTLGTPAAFLRLQGCPLNCSYCDTQSVWKHGAEYTFEELLKMMDTSGLINQLRKGQHLVLTGGSPLMQQEQLGEFLNLLAKVYGLIPTVEIENECIIMPNIGMSIAVDIWNNSPKLSNSGVPRDKRYKPNVIKCIADFQDSWFKFVINREEDWDEIQQDFLDPGLINRSQIILMPCGETFSELKKNQQLTVDTAIRENVLYRTREHIVLWDVANGI